MGRRQDNNALHLLTNVQTEKNITSFIKMYFIFKCISRHVWVHKKCETNDGLSPLGFPLSGTPYNGNEAHARQCCMGKGGGTLSEQYLAISTYSHHPRCGCPAEATPDPLILDYRIKILLRYKKTRLAQTPTAHMKDNSHEKFTFLSSSEVAQSTRQTTQRTAALIMLPKTKKKKIDQSEKYLLSTINCEWVSVLSLSRSL